MHVSAALIYTPPAAYMVGKNARYIADTFKIKTHLLVLMDFFKISIHLEMQKDK